MKVGSQHTNADTVEGLAGVTLTLYNGVAAPTTPAGFTCISDAQGDCNFTIPNTQAAAGGNAAGANHNRQFWVVQTGVPGGWFQNSALVTGAAQGPWSLDPYRFRTGPNLEAGQTYTSSGPAPVSCSATRTRVPAGIDWRLAELPQQSTPAESMRPQYRAGS